MAKAILLDRRIREQIAALRRSRRFVSRRESRELANEIDAIRAEIAHEITPSEPRAAAKVLETLVSSADRIFQRVDDSDGYVGDAYREAVRDWGGAWARIEDRDAVTLAAMIARECDDNNFGIKDRLVAAFADALGGDGLTELRKRFERALSATPADDDERYARIHVGRLLGEVADALGDVDGYIAAMKAIGWLQIDALGIAKRLSKAGRTDEALTALDQIRANVGDGIRAADLKVALLDDLSRHDDAQALRWAIFEKRLSPTHFLEYRTRCETGEKLVTERALDYARASTRTLEALWFFIAVDEHAVAEEFIIRHRDEIDGDSYETLRRVAKELSKAHPLGTLILHRAMADAVLKRANSTYYLYAVKDVRAAEELASRVIDWQGLPSHDAFVSELRKVHRLKSAFWKRYEG